MGSEGLGMGSGIPTHGCSGMRQAKRYSTVIAVTVRLQRKATRWGGRALLFAWADGWWMGILWNLSNGEACSFL